MFGKRSRSNTTVIGRGARFVGTLELEGPVHVEGQCEGEIQAKGPLSIGPHGSVTGRVTGKIVTIAGCVEGTVVANEALHVTKTGRLKGDVFYGRLQVDCGGVIDGRSHQGPPPVTVAESVQDAEDVADESTGAVDTRAQPTSLFPVLGEVGESKAAGLR